MRKATPVDSPLFQRQSMNVGVALRRAFVDKEEGKKRADIKNYFKAVKQGGECVYPEEPDDDE